MNLKDYYTIESRQSLSGSEIKYFYTLFLEQQLEISSYTEIILEYKGEYIQGLELDFYQFDSFLRGLQNEGVIEYTKVCADEFACEFDIICKNIDKAFFIAKKKLI